MVRQNVPGAPLTPRHAALLLLAALAVPARAEIPAAEVAAWPEEHQEAYAMMIERCGRCHTAEHALAPHLPMATWSKRLRAMAKLGPGLNGVEMSEVARFRIYYVARNPPVPPPPSR